MPPKLNPSTKKAKEAPPTNRGSPAKKKKAHTAPPAKKKAHTTPPAKKKAHTTPPAKKKAHTTPPAKKKVEKRTRKQQPKQPKRQGYRNGSAVTWNDHLARYRNANNCTLKQAMVLASPSWMESKYGSQWHRYGKPEKLTLKNFTNGNEIEFNISERNDFEEKKIVDLMGYHDYDYGILKDKSDMYANRLNDPLNGILKRFKWSNPDTVSIPFYEISYAKPIRNYLIILRDFILNKPGQLYEYVLIRLTKDVNQVYSSEYPLIAFAYKVKNEKDETLIKNNTGDEFSNTLTKDQIQKINSLLLNRFGKDNTLLRIDNPYRPNYYDRKTFMQFYTYIKNTFNLAEQPHYREEIRKIVNEQNQKGGIIKDFTNMIGDIDLQ